MLRSPSSVPHPLREVLSEGRKIEAVKDRRARNASFARHLNSPMRKVDFICRVRVWIDAHHAAQLKGPLVPPPIKVKPPRAGVDFDGHALCCAGGKNALDINLITGTAEKQPSCHVSENGRVRILDNAQNARRLRFTIKREPAMHTRNHKIELRQHFFGIIQRTVGKDVRFNAFEDMEIISVVFIQSMDFGVTPA